MPMKIGVLSDTHLHAVTDWFRELVRRHFHDVDLILHAGDIVSGPVLAYLESLGVEAVCGNMDLAEVAGRLPNKKVITAGPFRIGLVHGYGAPRGLAELVRRQFDQIDCLVFGHSHEPMNRRVGSELWFNPGSACYAGSQGRTLGILHITDRIEGEIIHLT